MGTNALDPSPFEILTGKFQYESTLQTGTPSGNYFWFRKRQKVDNLIQKNLPSIGSTYDETEGFKFIDIGCGDGLDLFLVRQPLKQYFQRCECLGLDGNPVNCYIAKLRKQYFDAEDVQFDIADLTMKLPVADNSIDFVYCSEVVEHLMEPEKLFEEIRRILKPKGFLVLTTPNEPNIFQKAFWLPKAKLRLEESKQKLKESPNIFKIGGKDIAVYGHISCRTNQEWDKVLAEQGFSLVDYRRGAIVYGATKFHDLNIMLGIKFILESLLDALPKNLTRFVSDELIALYRLR